jgi:3-dehydroquinate dehydratase-2
VNAAAKKPVHILVIHGPNLNMLGQRETDIYGNLTLDQIDRELVGHGERLQILVDTFQSNHEGALVDRLQEAVDKVDGIIINPAAYTHTSVALRDALLLHTVPIIEIHLSNIDKREPFRHHSYIADIASARIAGFGATGYRLALDGLAALISKQGARK